MAVGGLQLSRASLAPTPAAAAPTRARLVGGGGGPCRPSACSAGRPSLLPLPLACWVAPQPGFPQPLSPSTCSCRCGCVPVQSQQVSPAAADLTQRLQRVTSGNLRGRPRGWGLLAALLDPGAPRVGVQFRPFSLKGRLWGGGPTLCVKETEVLFKKC